MTGKRVAGNKFRIVRLGNFHDKTSQLVLRNCTIDRLELYFPSLFSVMLNRRSFHRTAIQLALGAAIPPIILKQLRPQIDRSLDTTSIGDRVTANLKTIQDALTLETELLLPTYLGNDRRRFYGRGSPQKLDLLHQFPLGSGRTFLGGRSTVWTGAGWTGQPTLTKDKGRIFLTIGSFDHGLKKIDLETHEVVWTYQFDDIIKGTATIYIDPTANDENRVVVLQGSRLSFLPKSTKIASSFRAISFRTGQELWRLSFRRTPSYSRDNDSSPIDLGKGLLFNAGENSIGYFLNGSIAAARNENGTVQPEILSEVQLYEAIDAQKYGGNLVTESSPARLGDRLFISAGGGRIWGIDIETRQIVWRFLAGGDLDGSLVISDDNKLFCALERERVPGQGGVFKIDPNKPENEAVEWFLPTLNRNFSTWQGGVIGSVALNDEYRSPEIPALFATNSIDGNLYIGSQHQITGDRVKDPFLQRTYNTPLIVFQQLIGASISTPIFTDGNRVVAAGYNGVYLFQLHFEPARSDTPNVVKNDRGEFYRVSAEQIAHFKPGISFESTPIVWDGLVRICSRDGWMYTLG